MDEFVSGGLIPLIRINPEVITNQMSLMQPARQIFAVKSPTQAIPIHEITSQGGIRAIH